MTVNYEKVLPLFVRKYGDLESFSGTQEEYFKLLFAFADGWGARDTSRTDAKRSRPKRGRKPKAAKES